MCCCLPVTGIVLYVVFWKRKGYQEVGESDENAYDDDEDEKDKVGGDTSASEQDSSDGSFHNNSSQRRTLIYSQRHDSALEDP